MNCYKGRGGACSPQIFPPSQPEKKLISIPCEEMKVLAESAWKMTDYNWMLFLLAPEVMYVDIVASVFLSTQPLLPLKSPPRLTALNGSRSLWQISPLSQAASLSTRWEPAPCFTRVELNTSKSKSRQEEWMGVVRNSIFVMRLKVSTYTCQKSFVTDRFFLHSFIHWQLTFSRHAICMYGGTHY